MKTAKFVALASAIAVSPPLFGQLNITDVTGLTGVFRLLTFNDTDIQISPGEQTGDLNVAGLGSNGILEGSFPNAAFRLSSFNQGTEINFTDSLVDVKSIVITSSNAENNVGIDTHISSVTLKSSTDILIQGKDISFGANTIFDTDTFTIEANSLVIDDPTNFFGIGEAIPMTSVNGSGDSLIFEEGIDFSRSITFSSLAPGGGGIWLTFDRINNVIDENFGFVDIVVSQTEIAVPEPSSYALLLGISSFIVLRMKKHFHNNNI